MGGLPLGVLLKMAAGVVFSLISLAAPCVAQDFDKLSKELTESDRETRREAALQLRELGAKSLPALPALIKALRDDDEQVAGRAVTTIAKIGPKATEAIPALIETMDPDRRRYDEQVVFRAAHALSEIGEAAIDPLREALKSKSEDRREGAAQALGLIGPKAAAAIPELVVALHDSEAGVRGTATAALGAIGLPALDALKKDLENSPSAAAAHAIGLMGKPAQSASDQLLKLAVDQKEPTLAAAAIEACGALEVSFDRLRPILRDGLLSEEEIVRLAAANTLLAYPQSETHTLPTLKLWLAADDAKLRGRAAWVVGQFGADAAPLAPVLIERLAAGDEQQVLTTALAGIGPGACGAALQAVENISLAELGKPEWQWARTILNSVGPMAIPALEEAIDSEKATARFLAIEALASMGKSARPLLPKFRRASGDPEAAVRLAALGALESAGAEPKRLATILQRRCTDSDAGVRAVAIRLIGQNQDAAERSFELVDQALGDSDAAVRSAAINALVSFGAGAETSVPKLIKLSQAADGATHLAILKTLAAIGSQASSALPLVRKSLEDKDPQIRGAAISALVAIEPDGESLTGVLSKMLADKDKAVRHPAIAGLGERGEDARSAAPQLFKLLDAPDDRAVALEALRRIRSRDVDLYITALDNREPRVRLFACEALGRLGKEAEKAIPQLEKAKKDRYDFVRKRADDAIKRIRGR